MNVFDILREKLREESVQTIPTCEKDGYSMTEEESMIFENDAIEIVNQVEQEYNNGWIDCSERLPEKEWETYITTHEDGSVQIHSYTHKDGFVFNWDINKPRSEVIAWQPLPPKYEPKGE